MKRFTTRIIVCLLPTLLSIAIVGWAYWKYAYVDGTGIRLGTDLVGGTVLIYEIDESKTQDTKTNKDDLAHALKKRIDPNDLYNVTIRPIGDTRVEIILPTGGRHQAELEQKNWDKVLAAAAEKFPGDGKTMDPYGDVDRNDRGTLVDQIAKLNPKANRTEIDAWVEDQTRRGGKEKRSLTGDDVENIKSLISRVGKLEFRILANARDDAAAMDAAKAYFATANKEELAQLEVKNLPPPPPRNPNGSDLFPVNMNNEPEHTYSWVEIGKAHLHGRGVNLNSEALAKDTNPHKADVKQCLEKGQPFTISNGQHLVWCRKITDWSRRNVKDRQQDKALEFFILCRNPEKDKEITGDYLVNAGQSTDEGKLAITFQFNQEGGQKFFDVTSRNKPSGGDRGDQRQLAIIFDNQVVSAPNLIQAISTRGQITGEFTQQEVTDMVRLLRAGALPAALKKDPVSENSMGPTLGEVTIKSGTVSVGLAFLAVMAFMVFYYRFAGLVACIALMANLLLTVAFMVVVQAAFTLPGLAGLVLMLGMAVDANVLIYERLREERDRGANLAMALRNGYDRAFPTILDTHLSSIFTAIVLYVVGNDQLKGFAVSLTMGLIISLFTSLYMTRTIFEIWLAKGWLKDLKFFEGLVKLIHSRYWDFMSIRHYWFAATLILTILGAGLFVWRADSAPERGKATVLNIDFTGGVSYTAQLNKPMTFADLRDRLEQPGSDKPLPDLSIQPIYSGSDSTTSNASSMFKVLTSLREQDSRKSLSQVQDYIAARLDKELKLLKLGKADVVKDAAGKMALGADLFFVNDNNEKDYASPAQVKRLLVEAFRDVGFQSNVFDLDRPTDRDKRQKRDDRYSELKLRLNEPVDPAKLQAVLTAVQKEMEKPQPEQLELVDKLLAKNMQEKALYAILASWGAILLYLWFRFGSWTFGAAAVLCLVHDLFFTLGVVAGCHYLYEAVGPVLGIRDFKIDLQAVAALLTLVGYSVNDTIVVFDRIREVRGKNPALTPQMINDSVNQTLTRTILASTTVLVVVLVLYIWGGEGVKLFAFVMIVGVIVGTYSSIYIASPLLLIFGEGKVSQPQVERAPMPAKS